MANVTIRDVNGNLVAQVEFEFSHQQEHSYLFVDIDADYAATFQLKPVIVLDRARHRIANLDCRSDGKNVCGEVTRVGHRQQIGGISASRAWIYTSGGERGVGDVSRRSVRNSAGRPVGTLSVQWGDDDEDFYAGVMRMFAQYHHWSAERGETVAERLRPAMHQNLMNIAGGAALVLNLV